MSKILLVAINAKYIHSNPAIYSLRAYAQQKVPGAEMEIAEYTINQPTEQILFDVYERDPGMLCISCYIWNIREVERLVREFHKVKPEVPIWLGGPEVSFNAEDVLRRMPEVTGVMVGEGEETFAALVKKYAANDKESQVETSVRETAEETVLLKQCLEGNRIKGESPVDMSEIPFLYENLSEFENRIIYYESSRGCPFSCSYCLSSVDKRLRFRDLSLVFRELLYFLDNNVPQVKFVDRTFNCKHDHAMSIWRYIHEHDNGVTNFHFEVSADLLTEEELALLASMRPGLVQLEIGVQSTNPETICEIRRTMDLAKLKRNVAYLYKAGNIHQHLDLIAGLPFEGLESFQKSFDDVCAMRPHQLQLGFLKVLKGSYMEEKKETYGLLYRDEPPYEVLQTNWLSFDDVLLLKGVEEMVEVYYNSHQFDRTLQMLEGEGVLEEPFSFYLNLWKHSKLCGYHQVQQKRAMRYGILLEFLTVYTGKKDLYRELLTLDYYLRENAKSRPEFAGEDVSDKRMVRAFYEKEEAERMYLPDYEGYDRNQLRKMTHLEYFPIMDVWYLFDYKQRDFISREARIVDVTETLGPKVIG